MSRQNLISAELPPAQKDEVMNILNTVRSLLPFLISLSVEQRIKLRKMGGRSLEFVKLAFAAANQFPQALPADFSVEEMKKDVELEGQLFEIEVSLLAITELVKDTRLALGSDNMKQAGEVYSYIKLAAKSDVNAKTLTEQMAKRYKKSAKVEKP